MDTTKWRFLVEHCFDALHNILEADIGTTHEALLWMIRTLEGRYTDEQVLGLDVEMWDTDFDDWVDASGDTALQQLVRCRKVRVVKGAAPPLLPSPGTGAAPAPPPPLAPAPMELVPAEFPAVQQQQVAAPVVDTRALMNGNAQQPVVLPQHVAPVVASAPEETLVHPQQSTSRQLPLPGGVQAMPPLPSTPSRIIITDESVLMTCSNLSPLVTVEEVERIVISSIREELRAMIRIAKGEVARIAASAASAQAPAPVPAQPPAATAAPPAPQPSVRLDPQVADFITQEIARGTTQMAVLTNKLKSDFPGRRFHDRAARDAVVTAAVDSELIRVGALNKNGQQTVSLGEAKFAVLKEILASGAVKMSKVHTQMLERRPGLFSDKTKRDDLVQLAIKEGVILKLHSNKPGHLEVFLTETAKDSLLIEGILNSVNELKMDYESVSSQMGQLRPDLFADRAVRDAAIQNSAAAGRITIGSGGRKGRRKVSLVVSQQPEKQGEEPEKVVEDVIREHQGSIRVSLLCSKLITEHRKRFPNDDKCNAEAAVHAAANAGRIDVFTDKDGVAYACEPVKNKTATRPLSADIKNRNVKAVVKTIEDHGKNGVLSLKEVSSRLSRLAAYRRKDVRDAAINETMDLGFVRRIVRSRDDVELEIVDNRTTRSNASDPNRSSRAVREPKRQRSPARGRRGGDLRRSESSGYNSCFSDRSYTPDRRYDYSDDRRSYTPDRYRYSPDRRYDRSYTPDRRSYTPDRLPTRRPRRR